jgi:hypothetical protein
VVTDGDNDEHGPPAELRFTDLELFRARSGKAQSHEVLSKVDGGRYWVTFQLNKA